MPASGSNASRLHAQRGRRRIQRPNYRNAFGMDGEGEDNRACEAVGPLYGCVIYDRTGFV